MNIIFISTVVVTFVGLCFYVSGFISAYTERKITTNFIEKFIIGSSVIAVASAIMFIVFGVTEGAYMLGAMAIAVMALMSMHAKVKEVN